MTFPSLTEEASYGNSATILRQWKRGFCVKPKNSNQLQHWRSQSHTITETCIHMYILTEKLVPRVYHWNTWFNTRVYLTKALGLWGHSVYDGGGGGSVLTFFTFKRSDWVPWYVIKHNARVYYLSVFDETCKWPTLGRRSWGNPLYFDSIFTVVESRSRNWGYYQSSRKSNILLT